MNSYYKQNLQQNELRSISPFAQAAQSERTDYNNEKFLSDILRTSNANEQQK